MKNGPYIQRAFIDYNQGHGLSNEFARVANINGCLLLVTSQYPDVYVCLYERFYCLRDLKSVLEYLL